MNNKEWALIDAETTGLTALIFVVELGAQKMRGWLPEGPSFRRLFNQNLNIPPASSRVHGNTRKILKREGDPAAGGVQSVIRLALEKVLTKWRALQQCG